MLVKSYAAAVQGISATVVTVEVNCSKGIQFFLVGLPDVAVRESHERIISALQVCGYKFPRNRIVINMAPADIRKEGSSYDLPLAIGILAAAEQIDSSNLSKFVLMGELSMDGSLQPIKGALPIAIKAREEGFKGFILPKQNACEAAVVNDLEVYGASNIKEVLEFMEGKPTLRPTVIDTRKEFYDRQQLFDCDFSDVRGQENVKRAMEVAAAGGHNLIMVGPPGSGKSILAKRLPTILPPFTLHESLETTKIHSVAGKIGGGTSLMVQRPFRSPHHTISNVAMVGGGTFPQPGEISLAHSGILFLDELPEFKRSVLEVLRQPLEQRSIQITRTNGNYIFPADFMLVSAMNTCPCGKFPSTACTCTPAQIQAYLSKISQPFLDRIDLSVEASKVEYRDLVKESVSCPESSAVIKVRVCEARKRQKIRYQNTKIQCNAMLHGAELSKYCRLNGEEMRLMGQAYDVLNLTARSYHRILKVARTIADLDYSEEIKLEHLQEAIGYRTLDRKYWGRYV